MGITQSEIDEQARAPLKARTEEGAIEERPIGEVIRADRYGKAAQAADAVPWGLRVARTRPGSSLG